MKAQRRSDPAAGATTAAVAPIPNSSRPGPLLAVVRRLRLWKRTPVHVAAVIATATGRWNGTVCDLTRYGAGITGSFELSEGDSVTLEFGSRVIAAKARWRKGQRAGLAFCFPLAIDDPLLGTPAPQPPAIDPDSRLMRRAVREQGVSWLIDD